MARRRMIDYEIWSNRKFIHLDYFERLLYVGLISWADDDGRLWNDPIAFKAKIFPGDSIDTESIESAMQELQDLKLIAFDDISVELVGWDDHQYIRSDIRKPSNIPSPSTNTGMLQECNSDDVATLHERNKNVTPTSPNKPTNKLINKINARARTRGSHITNQQFETLWKLYPGKSQQKGSKAKAKKKICSKGYKHTFEETKQAFEIYAKTDDVRNGFIKHMTTFLNGEFVDQVLEEIAEEEGEKKFRYLCPNECEGDEQNIVLSHRDYTLFCDVCGETRKIVDG